MLPRPLLYLVLALALAAFGYFVWISRVEEPAVPAPPPPVAVPLNTYRHAGYGFMFEYPEPFVLFDPSGSDRPVQSYIPVCPPEAIACLGYPGSAAGNTNFEGAGFSVNLIEDAKTEPECAENILPGRTDAYTVRTRVMNGTKFYEAEGGDAGAGHFSKYIVDRTFRQGVCLEILRRVGQSQFGNYPSGAVEEFTPDQEAAVWVSLARVFESLRFE